jgi:hypothetical protein
VGLISCALIVSACGESAHRYIANTDEKVYVRVPRDWNEVEFSTSDPDRLEGLTSQATVVWRAGATTDGDPEPNKVSSEEPLVFTAVYELSGQLNQQMSASLARLAASPTGFDPVLPSDDSQSQQVEVLTYQPLDFEGINGSRIIFRMRESSSKPWKAVYDVSAAYDSKKFRLYVLQVGCSAACYELNKSTISAIADSWLVKT